MRKTNPICVILLMLLFSLTFASLSHSHEAHQTVANEEADLYYFPEDIDSKESEGSNGLDLVKMIGRFHPILVHFPIAFLILAAVSEWYFFLFKKKNGRILGLTNLWIGTVSAVGAGISGWLLASNKSFSGEDAELFFNHRWLGLSLVGLSIVILGLFYALRNNDRRDLVHLILVSILAVFTGLTGHFGGALIYGSDYLMP